MAAWIIGNAKGTQLSFHHDEVQLELYWKGFRDYCKAKGIKKTNTAFAEETAYRYQGLFPHMRERIEEYNSRGRAERHKLNLFKPHNYVCNQESSRQLYNNLFNTEIDIVMSTPGYLLIGEAKHEETFGADSQHVLVHQLVRQYVMASILVNTIGDNCRNEAKKEIIPFVVCDCPSKTTKTAQVQFLHYMKWLCLKNVIPWEDVRRRVGE
ncbi:MAG: hypothetical protein ISS53_00905 [Dehalococcoidia bacterium]|nr:hypothetical protein [Dehalococcoidia bacterium]